MDNKVFISKGSTPTVDQRKFIDAVLDMLKTVGLSPRIMNENEWSHEQPLKAIKKIIRECEGIVIIAFTRVKIEKGFEIKKVNNTDLIQVSLATPWNNIEGSIAYSFDLPLLVIAENGLKSEGLIENGYDWNVFWTDLNEDVVKTESFKAFLQSWKKAVDEHKTLKENQLNSDFDAEKLTVGNLIKSMTMSQIWKAASAVLTFLIAIATISFKIGGGKWPWE